MMALDPLEEPFGTVNSYGIIPSNVEAWRTALNKVQDENRKLRRKNKLQRRELSRLNKAHAVLWKVVQLQANRCKP